MEQVNEIAHAGYFISLDKIDKDEDYQITNWFD